MILPTVQRLLSFRYWILGSLAGTAFIAFVAFQQHRAAQKYEHHRAEYCAALVAPVAQKEACIEKTASARDYLPWGYELVAWPEGITVWALLLTLMTIAMQTIETRKSADAALLNAQAIVNAERALLLFSYTKEGISGRPGESLFRVFVTNYGKAPARRLEVCPPIHALMPLSEVCSLSPPVYEVPTYIHEYLVPTDKHEVAVFEPAARWREGISAASKNHATSDIENAIYGQVTYYDGISPDLRHSRYCFVHRRAPFSNIGGSLQVVGTDEYLECT